MNDIEITLQMAGLMLSAIISDTLLFKSPTCTIKDEEVAQELAKIAKVDINKYGLDMLRAGADLSDCSAEQLLTIDAKEVSAEPRIIIAQINTVCIDDILEKKEEIESVMKSRIENENIKLFILAITDILNNNSKVIVLGELSNVFEKGFGMKLENNTAFLEGVVSRKKQIQPIILDNL